VAKVMGIDINSKEFWKNSLKTVEEDINEFIELSNK
jgi:oligoendopeptidase F